MIRITNKAHEIIDCVSLKGENNESNKTILLGFDVNAYHHRV